MSAKKGCMNQVTVRQGGQRSAYSAVQVAGNRDRLVGNGQGNKAVVEERFGTSDQMGQSNRISV